MNKLQGITLLTYPVKDVAQAKSYIANYWGWNRMSIQPIMLATSWESMK